MKRFVWFISLMIASATAWAQNDTIVALVNFYPGEVFYELEGHSALEIAIRHDNQVENQMISWGEFNFDAPNFLYRFVKGETDYHVAQIPADQLYMAYRYAKRRAVSHIIDMNSAQKRKLIELVNENLRPENATYRYNYVKDNCATRPLRMLELAIGDSIILGHTEWDNRQVSFRDAMRHYHKNYPWYQFGIDLALGSGIDYPLNRREMAFAPVVLDKQIGGATVGGKKLVIESKTVIPFAEDAAVAAPTPWLLSPTAVCWAIFLLSLWFSRRDLKRKKVTKWFDSALFGIFGLAGLLLTFLIFVSVHEATSPNWLFAWLNPFCLIPAIIIWLKKCKTAVLSYHFLNFVVLFILFSSWWALPQSANAAFLPLVLADMVRSASYIRLNYKHNAA